MYTIFADYTGAFPLPYPFRFIHLESAKAALKNLREMRNEIPEWNQIRFHLAQDGYNTWVDHENAI